MLTRDLFAVDNFLVPIRSVCPSVCLTYAGTCQTNGRILKLFDILLGATFFCFFYRARVSIHSAILFCKVAIPPLAASPTTFYSISNHVRSTFLPPSRKQTVLCNHITHFCLSQSVSIQRCSLYRYRLHVVDILPTRCSISRSLFIVGNYADYAIILVAMNVVIICQRRTCCPTTRQLWVIFCMLAHARVL